MFIPAAVGLVQEGEVLSRYGIGIIVATTISTILTMIVTVLVFRWSVRRIEPEEREE